jgi:hypothetical protein
VEVAISREGVDVIKRHQLSWFHTHARARDELLRIHSCGDYHVLLDGLRCIASGRDIIASGGRPPSMAEDQAFDDWAADVADDYITAWEDSR